MKAYCLVGPTYPFRGGIAHYTTLLARELRQSDETLFISFTRQYPRWLFPGRNDRDPSQRPLRADVEYLIDPLNPLSWRRTLRRIEEWAPKVVIIPWWVPYWAPTWAAIGRGVKRMQPAPKLLFICHNVLPHESGLLDRQALRLALRPADGFIAHSRADAEKLLRQFPKASVRVTPLPTYAQLGQAYSDQASSGQAFSSQAFSSQVTSSQVPMRRSGERPSLIFFGFVRAYKGLDILLEALPMVKKPVRLLIVGEFWEDEDRYRRQIRLLGVEDQVSVINEYVPDEQLALHVATADVAVLPYRSATQSAVIQVAFGQGTPVITTDVGGLAEVVDDGRTGLVVPPEDPPALAAAINRFFDEDLGPAMAAAIEQENERFSWSRLVDNLDQLASLQRESVSGVQ